MELVKLTMSEFNDYLNNNKLSTFYQSENYTRFMQENGFDYDLIGIKDNLGNIRAASLILINNIDKKYKYGYAPRGFIIDYNDNRLLKDFTDTLSKYYKKDNIVFIKINPNIVISKYNKIKNAYVYNDNLKIATNFKRNNFQELKKNMYFESILPTFSPIIDLKKFSYRELDKNVRNKISKSYRKGLFVEKRDYNSFNELYPLIKNKTKKSNKYYENLFREFDKNSAIDLFLVRVNFEEFLINTKEKYEIALDNNKVLSNKLFYNKSDKLINRKLQSDRELNTYKNDIIMATNGLSKGKNKIVGGAIVIKHKDTVSIYTSGYNRKYKDLNINDFLYYKIIEYYKYNYKYLDLNGITGDLSDNNPYKGLNNFIMGFNPQILKYIGEYDIVLKKRIYNKLSSNGTLTNIFKNVK